MTSPSRASRQAAWAAQCTMDTPLGPMLLACTPQGWSGAWFDGQAHHPGPLKLPSDQQHPHLVAARRWLSAYFDTVSANQGHAPAGVEALRRLQGRLVWQGSPGQDARDAFAGCLEADAGRVPIDPLGTPFQREVWALLLQVAPDAHTGYGALATKLGRPQASRAVGGAVGRNPLSVAVPCHRVLGASGALTGYAGGLDRKRWLLGHERLAGGREILDGATMPLWP